MDADELSDLSSPLSSVPSSPLSSPPESPTIPPAWRLPTPDPSQNADEDTMPPARKRRKVEPKERTTQHLDLTSETTQSYYDRQEALDLLLKVLRDRRKIVVIAGAGISVSAGIPDFRSSHGLFRSLRSEHKLKSSGKELFDAAVYKDDSSTSSFHDMVRKLSKMSENAKPTAFHRFLARLSVEGRLLRLYTQNVDGIETSLPPLASQVPLSHKAPWPQTIQLHGGLEKMMCQKCRHISDFRAQLFQGPTPPLCPECIAQDDLRTAHAGKRSHGVGKLRPRIVLYNEHNPDDEAIGAVTTADFRTRPDAVIVVGTSLKIPTVRRIVREMCSIVRDRRNGVAIWINLDSVPSGKDLEDCWDLIVKSESDEVARIANLRDWDDTEPEIINECSASDVERIVSSQGEVSVVIPLTPKKPTLLDSAKLANVDVATLTPPRSQDGNSGERTSIRKLGPTGDSPPKKIATTVSAKHLAIAAAKPPSKKALKNPASGGRSISEVLGRDTDKENKPRANPVGRPKGSLNKKPTIASIKSKMSMKNFVSGKVVKPNVASIPAKSKLSKSEPTKPVPLSPASKNTNVILFPNLLRQQYSSTEGSPVPDTPEDRRWDNNKMRDTISPTGSIPKDMTRLLN